MSASNLHWRKSSFSGNNGACVEIARASEARVAVRDSKNPFAETLLFPAAEIAAFLAGVRTGEFDDLI